MGNITMSKRESEQLVVFERLKNGILNQKEAAQTLHVSTRWVRKKFKRYINDGVRGLLHKNRGRPSRARWSEEHEKFAIDLLKSSFHGFGPTFAAEKLEEHYGIKVSRETLRKAMLRHGVWSIQKKHPKHRKKRIRRACRGLLVQLDGSPHDWFEGRGPKCTLLVFIDDATSELLWLEFAPTESVDAVMRAAWSYMEKHGIPVEFYTDYGSVFHVNTNNLEHDKITQFERALIELGCRIRHARSPQAKGRVERANKTLQDRLIKEMRLHGISSIEQANKFLRESDFIKRHNERFAVQAAVPHDAHMPAAGCDFNAAFCIKLERVLANDFTIVYNKRIFQLSKQQKTILRPKDKIMVSEHLDGSISLAIRSIQLNFTKLNHRPNKQKIERVIQQHVYRKAGPNHPWRKFSDYFYSKKGESRVKPALPAVKAKSPNI